MTEGDNTARVVCVLCVFQSPVKPTHGGRGEFEHTGKIHTRDSTRGSVLGDGGMLCGVFVCVVARGDACRDEG